MSGRNLEGAACAEINMKVVDHFFDIEVSKNTLLAKAAKNICARCVVVPECLDLAMNGPRRQHGIVAGTTVTQINKARAWHRYELGDRDTPPPYPRPAWLQMPEAAHMAEWSRLEGDPDEAQP